MKRQRITGQSVIEYAVLLGIVAAALITMQVYFKRGLQGKIRDLADQVSTTHYQPGNTNSSYTTTVTGTTRESYFRGVSGSQTINEVTTKNGYDRTHPDADEQ